MTNTFASALRRIATLPLIILMASTAACSDNSIAGPSIGDARQVGYTVTADGAKPAPPVTATRTSPTTTSRSGYTVPADALPPASPSTSVTTTSGSGK